MALWSMKVKTVAPSHFPGVKDVPFCPKKKAGDRSSPLPHSHPSSQHHPPYQCGLGGGQQHQVYVIEILFLYFSLKLWCVFSFSLSIPRWLFTWICARLPHWSTIPEQVPWWQGLGHSSTYPWTVQGPSAPTNWYSCPSEAVKIQAKLLGSIGQ